MMNIQSASLDVPGGCPNKCRFCVSQLSGSNKMLKNVFKFECSARATDEPHPTLEEDHVYVTRNMFHRLQWLSDKNVDTLVLTGTASEPHLNELYLAHFEYVNSQLRKPFINIEIQTSGVLLDLSKMYMLDSIGVKTVSLSISSLDSNLNAEINRTPKSLMVDIAAICREIKEFGFNLRLSLNINKEGFGHYNNFDDLFADCKNLDADQVTFRKLYATDEDTPENQWIKENQMSDEWWNRLDEYIKNFGRSLNRLPFGAMKYSIFGMSTVVDDNCMNKGEKVDLKYIVLRRNCKLYSEWDDPASLIF
jgi:MoaA/NifB/PqqE/SkfB family radical SAM enzyme